MFLSGSFIRTAIEILFNGGSLICEQNRNIAVYFELNVKVRRNLVSIYLEAARDRKDEVETSIMPLDAMFKLDVCLYITEWVFYLPLCTIKDKMHIFHFAEIQLHLNLINSLLFLFRQLILLNFYLYWFQLSSKFLNLWQLSSAIFFQRLLLSLTNVKSALRILS